MKTPAIPTGQMLWADTAEASPPRMGFTHDRTTGKEDWLSSIFRWLRHGANI
jgi:hypothetical protein